MQASATCFEFILDDTTGLKKCTWYQPKETNWQYVTLCSSYIFNCGRLKNLLFCVAGPRKISCFAFPSNSGHVGKFSFFFKSWKLRASVW